MKWTWDGGFRAHKRNEDGTVSEMVFTSSAQARQHVEQNTGQMLAFKHPNPRIRNTNKQTKRVKDDSQLTPEQKQEKQKILQMAQVKDPKTGEVIGIIGQV